MDQLGFTTRLAADVATVKERVNAALAAEGFGVLTHIDVAATLAEKVGATLPAYEILGACNPTLAHRAVSAAPSIGLLLPCNVVLRDVGGATEVSIIDPAAMFGMLDEATRSELEHVVEDARSRLARVVQTLSN